jgi:RNA polymerase sigma-70 factor, ECF subfamily
MPETTERSNEEQQRERSSFMTLAEQYRQSIERYCNSILRNSTDAQDVTQEVLIKAWQNRDDCWLGETLSKPWLFKVARNSCLDKLRRKATSPIATDPLPDQQTDPASTPHDNALMEEAMRKLRDSLEPRDFLIWTLHQREFSEEEIARQLPPEWKLTPDGVHSRLQRNIKKAISALREEYKDF